MHKKMPATTWLAWVHVFNYFICLLDRGASIRSAVLIIHGEKAHSYYFGKDAYENMIKNSKYTSNKELLTIPGAVHTDLYDNLDMIPFDKIQKFFKENGVG